MSTVVLKPFIINGWKLVRDTAKQEPVSVGDTVTDFRGDTHKLNGGHPPARPPSTGRVYLGPVEGGNGEMTYYPSVVGLKWIVDPDTPNG